LKIKEKLKEINNKIINVFNFLLLLPVYFIGVGFCHLLWRAFGEKSRGYWIKSRKLDKTYKKYLKQF
jgi:hypothetical protein